MNSHENNPEYSSPFPNTARGKTEDFTKRNPEFSESLPDQDLQTRAEEILRDLKEITVNENDGVITLSGNCSVADKNSAETKVRSLAGVRAVNNRITTVRS